jgi:hypothetical protein
MVKREWRSIAESPRFHMNSIILALTMITFEYTFTKLVLRPAVKATAALPWGDYYRVIRAAVWRAVAALLGL